MLKRLERDVLALNDPKLTIFAAGINDIAWLEASLRGVQLAPASEMPTAAEMQAGYQAAIAIAAANDAYVFGATITPFSGQGKAVTGFYSHAKEGVRQEVNQWIRTRGCFAVIIDFDELLRDPEYPERLKSEFDSGDGVQPSEAGYRAMGELVAEVILVNPQLDDYSSCAD